MSVPKLYQKLIMATYQKRGNKTRAIIRRAGYPTISKTFPTKKLAEEWALSIEAPMVAGELELKKELALISIDVLIKRYIAEETPKKKSAKSERLRLERAIREFPHLFKKSIAEFSKQDVVKWRDARLKQVSSASVLREMSSLSVVFEIAKIEWDLPISSNPFKEVSKPKNSVARNRRITNDEIEQIKIAFGYDGQSMPTQKKQQACWAFLFAIETACRASEICKLTWDDITYINDKAIAHLTETKNGSDRNVPLGAEARRLISLLDKDSDKLIGLKPQNLDALFRKYRPKNLADLHFHDTRHEALSRMARIVTNPMDLAKISGHRDISILLNVYYNPNNYDLIDLFD